MYSNESSKKNKTSGGSKKRSKKGTWGSRERTSMSFLIVIAFFAIFGIIILTEVRLIRKRPTSLEFSHFPSISSTPETCHCCVLTFCSNSVNHDMSHVSSSHDIIISRLLVLQTTMFSSILIDKKLLLLMKRITL